MDAVDTTPSADAARAARRASWRRLKQGPGWFVLAAVAVVLMGFGVSQSREARTPEERIEEISKQLACPICDGESVFDSRNPTSAAVRTEIRAQVASGQFTDAQVIAYIEERFGERVVLVPKAEGLDALVWILPVVALVGGVAGLAFAFRKWQRAGGDVPTDEDRSMVEAAQQGFDDESEGAR